MTARRATLSALVIVAAAIVAAAQGREGGRGGGQGGGAPAQLTIQQVKPGLYAILNPGANTLAVRVTSEGVILVDDMFEPNYEQIVALDEDRDADSRSSTSSAPTITAITPAATRASSSRTRRSSATRMRAPR